MHCQGHRLGSASYYTAADLCSTEDKLRKYFIAIMEVFFCFTMVIGLPADASTTLMTKGRQLQRAFKTRWLSSEAAVRARCEVLATWAALKQLSENKNDIMCVVSLRVMKTKNLNMLLSFCQHWHLT